MSEQKVKIGNGSHKRTKFDLSHENNTTSDFGFLQPIFGTELTPDCTIDVNLQDFIRLAPMPQPTFSRAVQYKKFGIFVPYEDIYKPFANLLSQQPYKAYDNYTYIPESAPYISVKQLTAFILAKYAFCVIYDRKLGQQGTVEIERINGDNYVDDNVLGLHMDYLFGDGTEIHYDFAPDYSDYVFDDSTGAHRYTWKLTKHGKNLYKILVGLGYQLDLNNDTQVSMLPLFAYYKAYFDLFYPQREMTWTNTNTYSLLNHMMQNDWVDCGWFMCFDYDPSSPVEMKPLIASFFDELANCYFTYSQDYFSAQLGSVSLERSETELNSIQTALVDFDRSNAYSQGDSAPYADNDAYYPSISAMQVWLVERLTKFVNKNTIVGGKIADWLRAHGMGHYVDEHNANYCGTSTTNIQVFDVDCTATTDQQGGQLGNYAGKGVGSSDKPSSFKYTANCYGHFIIMGAIVPNNAYYQGINPKLRHCLPKEFYTPEFDSLGMVATEKGDIMAKQVYLKNGSAERWQGRDPFGLVPRYSEYKQQQSIVNGDMSLNSSKLYLAGYHLNRMFSDDTFIAEPEKLVIGKKYICHEYTMPDNFANSIEWRFCGKYDWMGNFNRIFYNDGGLAYLPEYADEAYKLEIPERDNFIIHHMLDVSLFAPYIPMSHSYITDADAENAYNYDKQ